MKPPTRLAATLAIALAAAAPAARAVEFTVLHEFPAYGNPEFNVWGNQPGNLTMDADGVMFGCTTNWAGSGGAHYGVAFRLRPEGVIEKLVSLPYTARLSADAILWRTDQNSQIPDHSAFWWGGDNVICRLHASGVFQALPRDPLSPYSTYGTPTGQLVEVGGYFFVVTTIPAAFFSVLKCGCLRLMSVR